MLKRYSGELLYLFKKDLIKKCLSFENFSTFKVQRSPAKFVVKLMPDIESKLEAAEMKHRKHPGIRKTPPVTLPEWLKAAVDRVVSQSNEKDVINDAEILAKYLYLRRLPIEREEVQARSLKILDKLDVGVTDESTNEARIEKYRTLVEKKLKYEMNRWKPIEYTRRTALAYLVARLPANYAAVSYVFSEIMAADSSFKPKTFFDFGSGVGSATWAAHNFWDESLKEYFCIDASAEMNTLCEQLLTREEDEEDEDAKIIKNVHFRQFFPASSKIKYNLVVSLFSMMDMPSFKDRLRTIDTLWQKTDDMLVLVENGSRAGFSAVLEARDYILQIENKMEGTSTTGAHIVAPCPHESMCPLIGPADTKTDPCHFFARYYSPYPKQCCYDLKTDVFTFIVLRRGRKPEGGTQWPRFVKPVLKSSRKVHCRLCCPNGKLQEMIVTKRVNGRHVYRCARQCKQGDAYPVTISPVSYEDSTVELDNEIEDVKHEPEELEESNECCK